MSIISFETKIFRAGEIVRENLVNPPGQEDLCAVLSISEYQFRRQFRKIHRMTLGAYTRFQRMKKAATLLSDTKKSVSHVACEVGFRNPSRFADAFRNQYGVNPLQFRKACMSEKVNVL